MPGSSKHASAIFRCCFLRNMYVNCAREISYSCFLLVRTEQQESWRVALSTPVENSAGWLWLVVVAAAAACASSSATFSIHPIGRALSPVQWVPSPWDSRILSRRVFAVYRARACVGQKRLALLRARAPRFNFVRLLIVHFAFCARLDSTPAGATCRR